jgi:NADP-dependent 3-hydroxy acid dehydrogenase YdfG
LKLEHWQKVIGVNLMGVIYGTTYAYSVMVRQQFGHIINIASLAGLIGYPMNTPYATTKYGVVGLSTSLRQEAAEQILKGVVRNKAIITFPFYTGLLWKIHRLHPGLLSPLGRKTVGEYRKSQILM